jgi:hypothetical protein
MVINVRSYADFKLAANTLRHLDAVFYKNSVSIIGNTYGVAYAFDYQAGMAVSLQVSGGISFSTTDFPSAVALGDHVQISAQSALADSF